MMAKIIVVGGSFAGLTAAYELRKKLGTEHQVLVLSNHPKFVFIPSMPWVAPPERTPIPTGVPKTGYMSEHMAKTAAANVVAEPVFPPQVKHTLRPGKWVHGAKIAFERYFIWKMKYGMTQLP